MGYIALPKSSQDTGIGKDGVMKEGIDPDKIQLQVFQPENKGQSKEERASVSEVESSNSYFDNIDNERRQTRQNFLN
ncbi:20247_t:CDS:2 [Gigaspora margarita]|uniref:20247_t:CDS:1 n=1 Tax=Gigaspora margarita TaxID=4874 RepID=A0ABN7WQW2_GIGMA|nr:20247_t:CDS:2 [Gigaspora margarita]